MNFEEIKSAIDQQAPEAKKYRDLLNAIDSTISQALLPFRAILHNLNPELQEIKPFAENLFHYVKGH